MREIPMVNERTEPSNKLNEPAEEKRPLKITWESNGRFETDISIRWVCPRALCAQLTTLFLILFFCEFYYYLFFVFLFLLFRFRWNFIQLYCEYESEMCGRLSRLQLLIEKIQALDVCVLNCLIVSNRNTIYKQFTLAMNFVFAVCICVCPSVGWMKTIRHERIIPHYNYLKKKNPKWTKVVCVCSESILMLLLLLLFTSACWLADWQIQICTWKQHFAMRAAHPIQRGTHNGLLTNDSIWMVTVLIVCWIRFNSLAVCAYVFLRITV